MSEDRPPADGGTGPAPATGTHDVRATAVVAAGLLISKPTGYVRDALLAARFGTGAAMGAYTLASTATSAVFDVIATPLSRVLVPVLVRSRRQRGEAGLRTTAMAVLWTEALLGLLVGVALLAAAGPLGTLLAGTGASRAPTVALLRWLCPLPLAMILSAYATAWLQSRERFTLPAFTGLPLDLTIIAFLLLARRLGIVAAAWGLLLGTLAQYGLQWFGLRRFGHRLAAVRPAAALADPGLRATAAMAVPLLVSAAAVAATNLLQQALAARLALGTVAAFGYALRVLDVPAALFILPATAVVLPRLAAFAASRQEAVAAGFFREAAWVLSAGLLPCALLLALLAHPLAAALYEHGAFTAGSVQTMASSLAGFAPGVLSYGMQQLMRTRFYSRQDARTPMLWDLAALGTSAAFDLGPGRALGGMGLALGWSLGSAVAWVGLARAARGGRSGSAPYLRALGAGALALVAAVALLHGRVPDWLGHAPWRAGLAQTGALGLAGAAAYAVVLGLCGGLPLLQGIAGRLRRAEAPQQPPSPR